MTEQSNPAAPKDDPLIALIKECCPNVPPKYREEIVKRLTCHNEDMKDWASENGKKAFLDSVDAAFADILIELIKERCPDVLIVKGTDISEEERARIAQKRCEDIVKRWMRYSKVLKDWAHKNRKEEFLDSLDAAFADMFNVMWWRKTELGKDPELAHIATAMALESINAEWMRDDRYHLGTTRNEVERSVIGKFIQATLLVMLAFHPLSMVRYEEAGHIGEIFRDASIRREVDAITEAMAFSNPQMHEQRLQAARTVIEISKRLTNFSLEKDEESLADDPQEFNSSLFKIIKEHQPIVNDRGKEVPYAVKDFFAEIRELPEDVLPVTNPLRRYQIERMRSLNTGEGLQR